MNLSATSYTSHGETEIFNPTQNRPATYFSPKQAAERIIRAHSPMKGRSTFNDEYTRADYERDLRIVSKRHKRDSRSALEK